MPNFKGVIMVFEALTKKDYQTFIDKGLIRPYEQKLLDNLRDEKIYDMPLSIFILSKPCCVHQCYPMSVLISTGMDDFTIVQGNIKTLPHDLGYPNHSWVEKDNFVYDTTDGFKWDKALYYELFEPEVCNTITKEEAIQNEFYQTVLNGTKKTIPEDAKGLIIQYLELLEQEKPTVNHHALLDEITLFREETHLPIFSKSILDAYQKQMKLTKENSDI